jgi:tRNA pseudouridine38-40 synthase
MPSQRYKLTIAYRGTRYHGWQEQPWIDSYKGDKPPDGGGLPTIQDAVRRAVQSVVQHPVTICGSSRTDAGVHAKGQVAHFDTDQIQIPIEGLRRGINARLPDDILIRAIDPVPDSFDSISCTTSKRYQYFIWNADDRPVLFPELAWHRWQRLDLDPMRAAAAHLVGEHDFASFARPGHGRDNTIRTLLDCSVSRRGPILVIGVEGTGFLWNMVRIIVGTLVEVGVGRYASGDIPAMLVARDRQAAGPTAPAHGLYLHWIKAEIARQVTGPVPPDHPISGR